MVCRNPHLLAERARKREDLLQATGRELDKVKHMVEGRRGSLRDAAAGRIGERVGRVSGSVSYQRKTEQIEAEATLDGIYVLRTTCAEDLLTARRSCVSTSS